MGSARDTGGSGAGRPQVAPRRRPQRRRMRLIGIDVARGLALFALMAVHILPGRNEDTGEPTLSWHLFAGDSAALFALLVGAILALSSGGRQPYRGRSMTAFRAGLAVRAVLVAVVAMVVGVFMPEDPPAYGILFSYVVLFLLAIPFLGLGVRALFVSAAVFAVVAPVLIQQLAPVLPEGSSSNPTLWNVVFEPAALASQLLLTGSYPALPYMVFILVGLGLGRLDLRNTSIQVYLVGVGASLAILANAASAVLIYAAGGYEALLETAGMTMETLDVVLAFGPDVIPDTSAWWLVIATPYTNTPLALTDSLGVSLLVTGLCLLIAQRAARWVLPLAAIGTMAFTLYSAHLLALSFEVHYEEPVLWLIMHLLVAVSFTLVWNRWVGRGPLESVVSYAATNVRRAVEGGAGTRTRTGTGTAP